MAVRRQAVIELTEAELGELRGLAARRTTAQAMALRARIVLASATGVQHKQVAAAAELRPTDSAKVARPVHRAAHGGAARRTPLGCAALDRR